MAEYTDFAIEISAAPGGYAGRAPAGATVAGVNDTIFALAPANDEWIVGGKFTEFGEVTNASGLARWGSGE